MGGQGGAGLQRQQDFERMQMRTIVIGGPALASLMLVLGAVEMPARYAYRLPWVGLAAGVLALVAVVAAWRLLRRPEGRR